MNFKGEQFAIRRILISLNKVTGNIKEKMMKIDHA
jgi:hypothetical protein